MKSPLRRITIIFSLLAVLPAGYLIYELASWNRNEKLLQDIYKNQLDAILFSVNQFSDDLVSSWATKISMALASRQSGQTDTIQVPAGMTGAPVLFISDGNGKHEFLKLNSDSIPYQAMEAYATYYERDRKGNLDKLMNYFDAGFRKIEPADSVVAGAFIPMVFVLDREVKSFRYAILFINIEQFIRLNLGPRMQTIAVDKFVISVYRDGGKTRVFSSIEIYDAEPRQVSPDEAEFRKPLWLIPGYELGIEMGEASLAQLVNERVRISVGVLIMLLVILVFGVVFLYRNIRYQIRLSQSKSEFVSNVSHEIRTPLSLISMYAETLEMNRVPESKKQEYYQIISKETARLTGIVNRILNFSKMEANKKEYRFSVVNINELCSEILKSYSGQLAEHGFSVKFIPDEQTPTVEGDRDSIAEALINLLDNAVKYSRDIKEITVSTKTRAGVSVIEVTDKGIGIPSAYHKDIFEQFYRAPMGNVHQTKGSGLGLSIVKKTMEAHRGRVEVSSALDKGSTFRLVFPTINVNS